MLKFKKFDLSSISEVNEFIQYKDYKSCDYTVGAIFMWREFYKTEYAIYGDHLFFKVNFSKERVSFTLPLSKGDSQEALNILEDYTKENGIPLEFCVIPEGALSIFMERYKDRIDYVSDRDVSDYLYTAEDLSELKGRRYSGQRNHINKFKKLYSNYKYEVITPENKVKVIEFYDYFMSQMMKTAETAIEESKKTMEVLECLEQLPLFGGFISIDDKIVAMSIGEVINDTLYIHIEKALKEYQGSYQMIVNEFAKNNVNSQIKFINREDDAGDMGLRTSKLSYHPCEIIHKYNIKINV